MGNTLRRNSSLLLLSQAINAVGTFTFWIICAHLFQPAIIGLSTAFVSFGNLVSTFTNLGLPNTVVRFLPTSKKQGGLFTAALLMVVGTSLVGGLVALALIKVVLPKLGFVQSSGFLGIMLVLFVIFTATSALMDGVLMAFRKGEYVLGKALIINIPRILIPFCLIGFNVEGIVAAYVLVFSCGIGYNLVLTLRKLLKGAQFKPNAEELKQHKGFSLGNYFGGMLGILPSTLVPLVILTKIGPAQAAYFYMPMQIAAFLSVIAGSTSQALVSECSQNDNEEEHKEHFKNAFLHLYQSLIPIVLLLSIMAWPILRVYGEKYVEKGLLPLLVLLLASLFVGINWLGDTWLNIQKRTWAYFFMNGLNAVLVVVSVYLFAAHGLVAASVGWLLGQVVSAIAYIVIFARDQLFFIFSKTDR